MMTKKVYFMTLLIFNWTVGLYYSSTINEKVSFMKKTISFTSTILLFSSLLLVGCTNTNQEASSASTSSSSSKLASSSSSQNKSSKSSSSTSRTSRTQETAVNTENRASGQTGKKVGNESSAAVQESAATNNNVSDENQLQQNTNQNTATNVTSGISTSGSWSNAQGNSITIDENGNATLVYADPYSSESEQSTVTGAISLRGNEGDVTYGNLGGFPVILIPAGVANPHDGSVVNADRVLVGGTAEADDFPYYRQ